MAPTLPAPYTVEKPLPAEMLDRAQAARKDLQDNLGRAHSASGGNSSEEVQHG